MTTLNLDRILINLDVHFDYIPCASIITNTVNIFIKYCILPILDRQTVDRSNYLGHLREKEIYRIGTSMVPLIGNLFLAISDFSFQKAISDSSLNLKNAPYFMRNDEDEIKIVIKKDPAALEHASNRLKNNFAIVASAVAKDPLTFQLASPELQKNKELAKLALSSTKKSAVIFKLLDESLKNDPEILKVCKSFETYKAYEKLNRWTDVKKSDFTEEQMSIFMKTVSEINQSFDDPFIHTHLQRMSGPSSYERSLQDFNKYEGYQRDLVRLHEIAEILFLKWDYFKDFEEQCPTEFWGAHTRAIYIENFYQISLASEMGIPLSFKALEYLRPVDEFILSTTTYFHIDSNTTDIEKAIKALTKNRENLPSFEEVENYVRFMLKSGINKQMGEDLLLSKVWTRFFFSFLQPTFPSESCSHILLMILNYCVRNNYFTKYPPKLLLDSLTQLLTYYSNLNMTSKHLFENAECIRREQNLWHFPYLVTDFDQSLNRS